MTTNHEPSRVEDATQICDYWKPIAAGGIALPCSCGMGRDGPRPATPADEAGARDAVADAEAACWNAVHHYAHGGVLSAAPHLREEARRGYKTAIRAYGDARARAASAVPVPRGVLTVVRMFLKDADAAIEHTFPGHEDYAAMVADRDAMRAWLRATSEAEGANG